MVRIQLNGFSPRGVNESRIWKRTHEPVPDVSLSSQIKNLRETRRQSDLTLLKDRWLALKGEDRDGKATITLTAETVERLSCSDEMAALLVFLHNNGMEKESDYLMRKTVEIFASPEAREARATLCGVSSLAYRRYWSFEAGMHCPVDEVDGFQNALGDATAKRNASFGRCAAQAISDPIGSWRTTLGLLPVCIFEEGYGGFVDKESNIVPDWSAPALGMVSEMVGKASSDSSVFEEMVGMMPHIPKSLSWWHPLKGARRNLLYQWSKNDSISTKDYILANLSKLDRQDMGSLTPYAPDLGWIDSNIPKGPYYDALLDYILDGVEEETPEYRIMAERINDPKRREFYLSRFSSINSK